MPRHAIADGPIGGVRAELLDVARAFPGDPDGLRQNRRTVRVDFAYVGLQTGENASSTGLNTRAQGPDVGVASSLRLVEHPGPLLRTRAPGTRKQQRPAERGND